MNNITVGLGNRSYDILIGAGVLNRLGAELRRRELGTHAVLISNSLILKRHGSRIRQALSGAGFAPQVLTVADSETSKSMDVLARLLGRMAGADRPGRRLFLVLAGGGVVGDLGGLAAGLYRRGIPYVQLPTTLLAQVDSSVGGKTAVDLPQGKNLVGLFNQPKLVLMDLDFLKTLPDRQFRSGLSEALKCGVIADEQLFKLLERTTVPALRKNAKALEEVVYRAVRVKASVVEKDEYEKKDLRTLLNFGHTFGHALEASVGFSRAYTHGEAVAIGMIVASGIARRLGMLSPADEQRIGRLIRQMELPVSVRSLDVKKIMKAMAHDKKWAKAKNRWVLPVRIGHCVVRAGVPEKVVQESMSDVLEG